MNKDFIDYIDSTLKKPAPRAATYWRGWASQTDLPLQDRDGIVQSFSDTGHLLCYPAFSKEATTDP